MLATNVAVEPLVDGWPAWLMLLDPVTAGFFRRRHLELLTSYSANPVRHARALKDARLTGGSFCDLESVPIEQVASYRNEYEQSSREYLRFASDLEDVRESLATFDYSRPLPDYADLPASLRGRIELRYDYLGRQTLRLLRGTDALPAVNGAAIWPDGSARPGILSTPRLPGDQRAHVTAVSPHAISMLSSLHHRAVPFADFEKCAVQAGVGDPRQLAAAPTQVAGKTGIRFLGHASVAMPIADGVMVSDPLPPSCNPAARGLADVRLVLISHGHPDHFSPEALLSMVPMQPTVVVPASGSGTPFDPALKPVTEALGFERVVELRPYETFGAHGVTVRALPFLGEHGGLAIDSKSVFEVHDEQMSVLLAADATGLDPQVLASCHGSGRTVCLVIGIEPAGAKARWLYGPVLGKGPAGLRLAEEPLAGADAIQVMALARASGARVVRIYGTGAPGMEHVLGRSTLNVSRAEIEAEKLLQMPGAEHLDIKVLACPGELVTGGWGW